MSGAYARPELLASPDWLAENLGRPQVRVLDVRWRPDGAGKIVFAEGHLPGATHLDWREALTDGDAPRDVLLLAPPDQVGAALASAGVGTGTTVVLYDDTASLYAARAWWSLRVYGLDSVRILDGGFAAWTRSGRPLSHAVPETALGGVSPRAQLRARLTTSDVRALVGTPDALVLDARTAAEYRGFAGTGSRLGHIPGAVNLPVAGTTEAGTGASLDGIRPAGLLSRAGVSRSGGWSATTGRRRGRQARLRPGPMGHDDVAVYDGGWAEWGNRLELPIER